MVYLLFCGGLVIYGLLEANKVKYTPFMKIEDILQLETAELVKARKSKSIVVWFLAITLLAVVAMVGVQFYRTRTLSALIILPIGLMPIVLSEFSKLSKMDKELKQRQ